MRIIPVLASVVFLSACASQSAPPEKAAAAPAAAPAAKSGAQCYSGDHGKFFNVDEKTSIAGVAVICKATADGKSGQWVGSKH
jgi:hypothetical protein